MDRVERLAELGRERTACIVAFPDGYDVSLVLKSDAAPTASQTWGRPLRSALLMWTRIESLVVQRILGAAPRRPSLAYTPDRARPSTPVRNGRAAAAGHPQSDENAGVFAVADAGTSCRPGRRHFVPKVRRLVVVRAV